MGNARFGGVDLLRGFSILAVILLHISLRLRFAGHPIEAWFPRAPFHFFFWNGNNGVQVFFAVSGFLITLTSLRRFGSLAALDLWRFYRLRFARIAPLLLALLAILSALHLMKAPGFVIPPEKASLGRALTAALTFHLNWLEAERGYLPACWDVLWSLSVEEMFYLCFPLACLALRRWQFVLVLVALAAMGPLARTVWAANEIWQEKSYLGGMDAIALGCLAALLTHWLAQRPETPSAWWCAAEAAGIATLLLVAWWPAWPVMKWLGRAGLDGTALAVGTCLVMISTVLRGGGGAAWGAPIRWLGRHSYEVYLTHEFVVIAGTAWYVSSPAGAPWLWIVAITLVSAALGGAVARWFSEPWNRRLRP